MAAARFTLLVVDDNQEILQLMKILFSQEEFDLPSASSAEEALSLVDGRQIDCALLDLQLPGMDGLTLLKKLKERNPRAQLCIMTGHGQVRDAVDALRAGAADFLEKPLNAETVTARVSRMYEVWRLQQENTRLREERQFSFGYERLVGNSHAMRELKGMISRIAATDALVLIQGETGTGKELVARAIHCLSKRAAETFTAVDCASISESLLESEIFGHEKGAFTGADRAHPGLVRATDRGTIFFDEVGELSSQIQAKMLRLLQEQEVRPVGSVKSFHVDVRVIAATNRDLAQEVAQKAFREDLYYRLKVLVIRVPPLRERWEDIPVLARHFMETLRSEDSMPREISPEVLELLEAYEWPGNVREMENVIRRALILGRGPSIGIDDLPGEISGGLARASERAGSLAACEKEAIHNALAKAQGKRRAAARILGISEATLYRKLKEYEIQG